MKKSPSIWLAISLSLLASSCEVAPGPIPTGTGTSAKTETKTAVEQSTGTVVESRPAAEYKADWPSKEFTVHLSNALEKYGEPLLKSAPGDVKDFCPNYGSLTRDGRKQFYIMLFSALAKHESNFNPKAQYLESFTGCDGKRVSSRGLFQMSFCSSVANYKCAFKDADEVYDPQKNIECAVRAAAVLVPAKAASAWGDSPAKKSRPGSFIAGQIGSSWQGMAAYWSPFRTADRKSVIMGKTKAVCK